MSLDLSTLKVGDLIEHPSYDHRARVTAVGEESFLFRYLDGPWAQYEFNGVPPSQWRKVEPPLIDPEQVYAVDPIHGDIYSLKINKVPPSYPRIRITSYEVVDP